jgi:hypothetical protein
MHTYPSSQNEKSFGKFRVPNPKTKTVTSKSGETSLTFKLVIKYIGSFTSKPGVCKLFSYKFRMEADRHIVGYNRPTAFALRPAVRQQKEQMLKDDILEASSSPFLNPLTTVQREDWTLHPRY